MVFRDPKNHFDVIVVGGGLFGTTTALRLARDYRVLLLEKNGEILKEASFINQNRVHFGFHYPRSMETALESLDGYELFKQKLGKFFRSFENYYAIVQNGSLTSPNEFFAFAEKLKGARKVEYQSAAVDQWFFRPQVASALLQVYEPVIDMVHVRKQLMQELKNSSRLTFKANSPALKYREENSRYIIETTDSVYSGDFVVNASFGNLLWHNHPRAQKMEVQYVEMVELESDKMIPGITLMDGPGCFGILPLGFTPNRYWWYSVAYSVHMRTECQSRIGFRPPLYSNWDRMKAQGEQYFTFMSHLRYVRSHFTPRAFILSDKVDQTAARPSVISELSPGFYQVLSGKLTTCYKVAEEVAEQIAKQSRHSQAA